MKAPQQSLADPHAPDRRLSRRSLLGAVTAATFAAATAGSTPDAERYASTIEREAVTRPAAG